MLGFDVLGKIGQFTVDYPNRQIRFWDEIYQNETVVYFFVDRRGQIIVDTDLSKFFITSPQQALRVTHATSHEKEESTVTLRRNRNTLPRDPRLRKLVDISTPLDPSLDMEFLNYRRTDSAWWSDEAQPTEPQKAYKPLFSGRRPSPILLRAMVDMGLPTSIIQHSKLMEFDLHLEKLSHQEHQRLRTSMNLNHTFLGKANIGVTLENKSKGYIHPFLVANQIEQNGGKDLPIHLILGADLLCKIGKCTVDFATRQFSLQDEYDAPLTAFSFIIDWRGQFILKIDEGNLVLMTSGYVSRMHKWEREEKQRRAMEIATSIVLPTGRTRPGTPDSEKTERTEVVALKPHHND